MSLAIVWPAIEELLSSGVNLIPVRDKQEGDSLPKTPYGKWKQFQSRLIDKGELYHDMERFNTEAVACMCGVISGNLEIIDIDSKYNEGISAQVFTAIKELYPDIYKKLRIHKTPSGGYHILYRISRLPEKGMPGNEKLAGRYTTEEEQKDFLKANPNSKRAPKTINFLETRGEGGYALAPPSLGYEIHQDNPIPVLDWSERCNIISICKGFTEITEEVKPYKPSKSESNYYDVNPFEDFNNRCNPVELMQELGWKIINKNSPNFIWFTRPGKNKGISASFNLSKRVFWIFTASTELEENRGYFPSMLLSKIKFEGDNKATYRHLTSLGYGNVKRKVEQAIVKQRAIKNAPLPNNFSDEARLEHTVIVNQMAENYPYGIFWEFEEDKISINREKLYRVAQGMGYRISKQGLCKVEGTLVTLKSDNDFFNDLKDYIKEEEAELMDTICNVYEAFIQRAGAFTISRIDTLDESIIIKDDRETCYKFYRNCFIEITSESITPILYDDMNGLVWAHKIQDRDWLPETERGTLYREYLLNSTGIEGEIPDHVFKVLGYLSHDYKEEDAGYIIVLTEKTDDKEKGGGSGKNIFGNILKSITTVKTVPGESVKFDDRFMNAWNYERIFFLADVEQSVNWNFLKEISTGEGYVNKKYKGEFTVPVEDMPKILINTNYSFDDASGPLKRRIIAVEFNEYYTIHKGVSTVHGKLFPKGFDTNDWADFDWTIAKSIQLLLKSEGKLEPTVLSESGWLKKFKQTYKETASNFIIENFKEIVSGGVITNQNLKNLLEKYYNDNNTPKHYQPSPKTISDALKAYCNHKGIDVKTGHTIRITPYEFKDGRKFTPLTEQASSLIDGQSMNESEEEIPF